MTICPSIKLKPSAYAILRALRPVRPSPLNVTIGLGRYQGPRVGRAALTVSSPVG